jgi:AraC-like DNA-binding protein
MTISKPMINTTVTTLQVRRIAEALRTLGIDIPAVCQRARQELATTSDNAAQCERELACVLGELAAAKSVAPALSITSALGLGSLDVLDYAMMSSADLGAALGLLSRHTRIAGNASAVHAMQLGDGLRLGFETENSPSPATHQGIEFQMLSLLEFCRWISGRPLRPLLVELRQAAPDDERAHRAAFDCLVRFDAPRDSILFAHADLALPLPTRNAQLAELHDRCAADNAARRAGGDLGARARAFLVERLRGAEPSRLQLAAALNMSERTLQRRLNDEGTCFQRLLDDTRRALAARYLANHNMALCEVAYQLGFADQSCLARATRRWFKHTPSQMRARAANAKR